VAYVFVGVQCDGDTARPLAETGGAGPQMWRVVPSILHLGGRLHGEMRAPDLDTQQYEMLQRDLGFDGYSGTN
jgi:hypothetical protein